MSKCRGDAATALSGLDLALAKYNDIVTLMCKMYGVGTAEEREQKFKMRKQQSGEEHQSFALKLRTLALWAFPDSTDDTVNRQLLQQFIAGLSDRKVAYEVHIRQPKSLFEATEIVSRIQSSLKMVYGESASLENLYSLREESFGVEDVSQEVVEAVRKERKERGFRNNKPFTSSTPRTTPFLKSPFCKWCDEEGHHTFSCPLFLKAKEELRHTDQKSQANEGPQDNKKSGNF